MLSPHSPEQLGSFERGIELCPFLQGMPEDEARALHELEMMSAGDIEQQIQAALAAGQAETDAHHQEEASPPDQQTEQEYSWTLFGGNEQASEVENTDYIEAVTVTAATAAINEYFAKNEPVQPQKSFAISVPRENQTETFHIIEDHNNKLVEPPALSVSAVMPKEGTAIRKKEQNSKPENPVARIQIPSEEIAKTSVEVKSVTAPLPAPPVAEAKQFIQRENKRAIPKVVVPKKLVARTSESVIQTAQSPNVSQQIVTRTKSKDTFRAVPVKTVTPRRSIQKMDVRLSSKARPMTAAEMSSVQKPAILELPLLPTVDYEPATIRVKEKTTPIVEPVAIEGQQVTTSAQETFNIVDTVGHQTVDVFKEPEDRSANREQVVAIGFVQEKIRQQTEVAERITELAKQVQVVAEKDTAVLSVEDTNVLDPIIIELREIVKHKKSNHTADQARRAIAMIQEIKQVHNLSRLNHGTREHKTNKIIKQSLSAIVRSIDEMIGSLALMASRQTS